MLHVPHPVSTVIGKAKFDEVGWVTICCRVTDMYIMKQGMMKLQCGLGNRILDYERRAAIRWSELVVTQTVAGLTLHTHTHLIQTDTVRKLVRGWSSISRE